VTTELEVYEPQRLKLWSHPGNYVGPTWPATYSSGFGQSRDSSALERANFAAAWKAIKAAHDEYINGRTDDLYDGSEVQIVRENHWAVGWVEWIAIHQDCAAALRVADDLREAYNDYPVVDSELFSEFENEDCTATWENCFNARQRLKYFRSHSYAKGYFPPSVFIRAILRGSWGDAAQVLNCPSDLIY